MKDLFGIIGPKIKEKALINNFDKGGLKDADFPSKITSLQY